MYIFLYSDIQKSTKKAATHAAAFIQQRNIQTYIAMLKRQAPKRLRRSIFATFLLHRTISLCERMFHKTIDTSHLARQTDFQGA
ncbi:hypothetical protein CSQ93_20435 [Janthinobacterium sp. BJB426]|nr:hypothetical protein CSQ93_20435 [Janthinobacterium sp. BJB426]